MAEHKECGHLWNYYSSRFAGTPIRECALCGVKETYWETDADNKDDTSTDNG